MIQELKEWYFWLLCLIPGRLGNKIRVLFLKPFFEKGNFSSIGRNSIFVSPENISFSPGVGIDHFGYFNADKGKIYVGSNTKFNHGVHINASIEGKITIGSDCLIGPNVVMRSTNHKFNRRDILINQQGHSSSVIKIDNDVWIGANSIILGNVHIHTGCVVGAGAVVTRDLPAFSVAVGVPAKVVKYRI